MMMTLMHRVLNLWAGTALLAVVTGCNMAATSSQAFNLPEGDAGNGRNAFVSLECTACHKVRDLDLPAPQTQGPVMVVLGGGVTRVKSYGELVTSIINPSHRLARGFPADDTGRGGESPMAVYNDVMTVTQLIDLVAFLQSQYDVVPRPGYRYPVYKYQ
jgi:L-cysteine S-thiosulfotransferase